MSPGFPVPVLVVILITAPFVLLRAEKLALFRSFSAIFMAADVVSWCSSKLLDPAPGFSLFPGRSRLPVPPPPPPPPPAPNESRLRFEIVTELSVPAASRNWQISESPKPQEQKKIVEIYFSSELWTTRLMTILPRVIVVAFAELSKSTARNVSRHAR